MFEEESHLRKVEALALLMGIAKKQKINLKKIIHENLEQMPGIISDLAKSGKWLKVNTEINRAIALAKLVIAIKQNLKANDK